MPVENIKCSGCGAPLKAEPDQDFIVCEYCSTTNRIVHDTKGGAIPFHSETLNLVAQEALLSKNKRQIESLAEKKDQLLKQKFNLSKEKDSVLSRKKGELVSSKDKAKKEHSDNLGLSLGCLGLFIWLAGIILIVYLLFEGEGKSTCIVLPAGFVLGALFLYLYSSRLEKRLKPIYARIDSEHQLSIDETQKKYQDEIERLDGEISRVENELWQIKEKSEETSNSNEDGETVERPAGYDLILIDAGPNKIETIRIIREFTNFSLKEAKNLAEAPDSVILENAARSVVLEAEKRFITKGAVVQVMQR